ncbi:protein translocase subunit SecD [Desulfoscipio geothermicus]|uniref:Protein translocase subunit SecD n=1 Tax=Desulfoscipio geothermicus DSM 3669 TaxID=1121426 RepID=A0A1I6EBL1_9FIRM|nr:protein translocase subunit SecD [Desulfoscipio geothermicus]SFR15094.1 preprotein translocase subunit SecD [Desulfoscipio geothermicus DSM 3669]
MRWSKILTLAAIVLVIAAVGVTAAVPLPAFKDIKWLPWGKEITLGLDLQGGVHVVLEAQDTPGAKVTEDSMRRAKAVLERRVNELGVAEPIIQRQGDRRIIVELAGVADPEKAVRDIIKPAYLEFKTADGETIITGADLQDAIEGRDPTSGQVQVNLTFTDAGTRKFAQATTANVGKTIGIYLDNKLLQNPVVREPITNGKAMITGYENLEEAHTIAVLLRSGALPVPLEVLEKRTVGPQLGQDSLERSINAGIVGIIAILVFMIVYYRVPGLIADLALLIYALIVLGIFIGIHATMTLPGIAGFLLSLGIAVDANVIIFERIKEELRSGKSIRSAIDAGFKRGFVAVFDANVTTLIAAAVLYYLSESLIRGFAVTLSIGILASMFTAITMTRWMLHLAAATNVFKQARYYGA